MELLPLAECKDYPIPVLALGRAPTRAAHVLRSGIVSAWFLVIPVGVHCQCFVAGFGRYGYREIEPDGMPQ